MSGQLRESRGLFFGRTGEPKRSYWASGDIAELVQSRGLSVPTELFNWNPTAPDSRSNCPVLHEMLIELIDWTAPQWRDRAENIYAGRTRAKDETAFSTNTARGGMVALSDQFTSILLAYTAMYAVFVNSINGAGQSSPTGAATPARQDLRVEFDSAVRRFKGVGLLALQGTPLMAMPSINHRDAVHLYARAGEQWTLAHELSHHLARDNAARRDKGVEALLAQIKKGSSAEEEIAALSMSQQREIEADLLATLLVAEYFVSGGPTPETLQLAAAGAGISLITVGHLCNEWTTDPGDEHPGCMDRLRLVMTFMDEHYGTQRLHPDDPSRSHRTLSRFTSTLRAFAQWAQDPI